MGVGVQVVQGDQSGREPPLAAASADIWALGVITFEVMSGEQPLIGQSLVVLVLRTIFYRSSSALICLCSHPLYLHIFNMAQLVESHTYIPKCSMAILKLHCYFQHMATFRLHFVRRHCCCETKKCLESILQTTPHLFQHVSIQPCDAGQRLFSKESSQADVVSMLLGYTPLPFEENPALFQNISIPPNAQNMLRQMLQRNPTTRPALQDVGPALPCPTALLAGSC